MNKLLGTLLLALIAATSATAETMYIDDTLLVPLRSGEGTGFRIVHKGLPSGTAVEILERNTESGYSKVVTSAGTEGYLPTRYLSAEPIARMKLVQAEQRVNTLQSENADLKTKLNDLQKNFGSLEKQHGSASSELQDTAKELERIKAISADALNLDRRNRELRESNEQLRNELEVLQVEANRLRDKSESNMMLMGGGLVLLGVILALVVPLLKPNKKSDSWA
jgi:SH3 domain protein